MPVHSDQLTIRHRTGLANHEQVTGTGREAKRPIDRDPHQGGGEARWVADRRGGNREAGTRGRGRPAAKDRGQKVEKMVGRWTKGKGAGGMAAGLGGTRRSVSRPHDRGHVIGHEWPW